MAQNQPNKSRRVKRFVVQAFLHGIATSTLFAAFVTFHMNAQVFELLQLGVTDSGMQSSVLAELGLMFGLAACAWSMCAILVKLFQIRRSELAEPNAKAVVKAGRGTILTETLIVLPVFFMLTFGLAQMAINSMAGLLTQLASYEVARTLAVWAPEEGNRADRATIEERARLVAASVIAPVVPMFQTGNCANQGTALPAMRRGLTGIGLSNSVGGEGKWSFADGFDSATFRERGPTKLTMAYCNTEVSWTGPLDLRTDAVRTSEVNARVQYHHPASLPLVGMMFTTGPAGTWGTSYVTTFDKSYMLHSYLTPNIYSPYQDPNYWGSFVE